VDDVRHISTSFLLDFFKQERAGFLAGHCRNALQFRKPFIVEGFDFIGSLIHRALAFVESGLALLHLIEAVVQLFTALDEAVIFLAEFAALVLDLTLCLQSYFQGSVFGFQLRGFGNFFCLLDNAFGGSFEFFILVFADD